MNINQQMRDLHRDEDKIIQETKKTVQMFNSSCLIVIYNTICAQLSPCSVTWRSLQITWIPPMWHTLRCQLLESTSVTSSTIHKYASRNVSLMERPEHCRVISATAILKHSNVLGLDYWKSWVIFSFSSCSLLQGRSKTFSSSVINQSYTNKEIKKILTLLDSFSLFKLSCLSASWNENKTFIQSTCWCNILLQLSWNLLYALST